MGFIKLVKNIFFSSIDEGNNSSPKFYKGDKETTKVVKEKIESGSVKATKETKKSLGLT